MPNMGMPMPNMNMPTNMGVYDDEDDYCHFGPTSIKSNNYNIFTDAVDDTKLFCLIL